MKKNQSPKIPLSVEKIKLIATKWDQAIPSDIAKEIGTSKTTVYKVAKFLLENGVILKNTGSLKERVRKATEELKRTNLELFESPMLSLNTNMLPGICQAND